MSDASLTQASDAIAPPVAAPADARPDRRALVIAFGAVALAAVLVYLNALANGFALDDVWIIERNTRVHRLHDLQQILLTPYWPFFGTDLGLYRPVVILAYALQWAAGGGAPWVFHAVSIVLHALASVLVLALALRFAPPAGALAGALLFAVHPVHAEAVANAVGQAELITACAVLAVCLLHTGRPAGVRVGWPRRVAYTLLFAVALGTKESAVVVPGLLVLLDVVQRRVRLRAEAIARYVDAMAMPVLLMGAVLALYLLFRYEALAGQLMGGNANPAMPFLREEYRVLNALRAFPEYLRLLVFPLALSADYLPGIILPVESVTPVVLFGLLLLAALVGLTLLAPWRPAAGLAAGWFLITMLTVSNLFFPVGILVAERTLYLPSAALALAVACAWRPVRARADHRTLPVLGMVAALVLVAAAARTWIRNPDWKSSETITNAVIRDHPESYRTQWWLASRRWAEGDAAAAGRHFEMAFRLYPRDARFVTEFANFLVAVGNYPRALELLELADKMYPGVSITEALLGYVQTLVGRHHQALASIARAERHGIARANSTVVRALAYEGLGRFDQASGAWRVAVQQPPSAGWRSWAMLSRTLARGGHATEAEAALAEARARARDIPAAHRALQRLAANHAAGCYRPGQASDACPDPVGPYHGRDRTR